ncbi:MAG TPA: hypothetical protein ENK98_06845, partial [Epsilonproteobacteria bacterium]|nr:hypothetical protein [Campylobacterota bacterium]
MPPTAWKHLMPVTTKVANKMPKSVNTLKLLFLLLFVVISFYILIIKTEKYQSNATVIIKDLSQQQSASMLGSMLLGQSSSVMQDSKLLELYIRSNEMFSMLNKEHNLTGYYSSEQIDFFKRLSKDALLPTHVTNAENLLASYLNDITTVYDEMSSTLSISFLHVIPDTAKKIVTDIITFSSDALNRFEKENTAIVLQELLAQEQENKKLFIDSI